MENYGLARENNYRKEVDFGRVKIDVDLIVEDYDNNEVIEKSFFLLNILVENWENIEKNLKEKVKKEIELEKFEIKYLEIFENKVKFYIKNEKNLILIYIGNILSYEDVEKEKYLKKIENNLEIKFLEKDVDFIEDEILGFFVREKEEFGGNIKLPDGKKVELILAFDEEDSTEDFKKNLENGRKIVKNIDELYKKIYDSYIEHTLELAQEWWEDNSFEEEDIREYLTELIGEKNVEKLIDEELTEEIYRKLLFLTSISIDSKDGMSVMAYDGQWIFGGHFIVIEGNVEGEFEYGDILG